eukprot:8140130-Pyramimonas_sp.AAC.1
MVSCIAGIYSERFFILKDEAGNSTARRQKAGIAQGCPLPPYLFIIVQSVTFFDVDKQMEELTSTIKEPPFLMATDLLCADDTILASSSAH